MTAGVSEVAPRPGARSRERVRRAGRVLAAVAVAGGLVACGDDGTSPRGLDLSAVAGLYAPVTLTFDPQGSAPGVDVLAAVSEVEPRLNIALNGTFQIPHRDPVSGVYEILPGTVRPTSDGVRIDFTHAAHAELLVLPRSLALTYDEAAGTLSHSGSASVSRSRLIQLFPDVYGQEQLFDPTPGTLTVVFQRSSS